MTPRVPDATSPSPVPRSTQEPPRYTVMIAMSAAATAKALPDVQRLLPPGWRGAPHQSITGATHTIAIEPPADMVDATAYLMPRTGIQDRGVCGWSVRVHNRSQRVDFPLYTAGGAHAAVFAGVGDATHAAVAALHVEVESPYGRR